MNLPSLGKLYVLIDFVRWRRRVKSLLRSELVSEMGWEHITAPRRDFLVGRLWRVAGTSLPRDLTPPDGRHTRRPPMNLARLRASILHLLLRIRPRGTGQGSGIKAEILLVKIDSVVLFAPTSGQVVRIDRNEGFTSQYVKLRTEASFYLNQSLPWRVDSDGMLIDAFIDGPNALQVSDRTFLEAASRLLEALEGRLVQRPPRLTIGLEALIPAVQPHVAEFGPLSEVLREELFLQFIQKVPCIPLHNEMRRRNVMMNNGDLALVDWDPLSVLPGPVWLPLSWILAEVPRDQNLRGLHRHWSYLREALFPAVAEAKADRYITALFVLHRPLTSAMLLQRKTHKILQDHYTITQDAAQAAANRFGFDDFESRWQAVVSLTAQR